MKYDYMIISGYVDVKVDAVDMEQELIIAPEYKGREEWEIALTAAKRKDAYLSLTRTLFQNGFGLKLEDANPMDNGNWMMTFKICPLTDEKIAA